METAWEFSEGMQVRNAESWTSVISGFLTVGQIDRTMVLFDRLHERNTVSWTAMVDGYVQASQFREAFEIFFREMQFSKVMEMSSPR
jgi:pentatricopeptide repeat protein